MKEQQVFVANGQFLTLSSGYKVVAMLPVAKGEKHSLALMDDGKIVRVPGQRIEGVGIPRYLKSIGYELAQPGNSHARILANAAYRRSALKMVETALSDRAVSLQTQFGGQAAWAVPFDPNKEIRQVQVASRSGLASVSVEFGRGIVGATVRTEFDINNPMTDPDMLHTWLVGSKEEAEQSARLTEYGGPVEHAAFILVNSGLATCDEELALRPQETGDYVRGALKLKLNDSDELVVGISFMDELEIVYLRNGAVLYKDQEGMSDLKLGSVVSDIASVIARVIDMDAAATSKKRTAKKAA